MWAVVFFGTVFRLSPPKGPAFALKVFYRRPFELEFSGAWSEAALGAYVTAKGVSNMPHLCAANPAAGWILSEFVDGDYESSTPSGPTWSELGLITLDYQKDADNLLCNSLGEEFRVDFGSLTSKERAQPELEQALKRLSSIGSKGGLTSEEFVELLEENPELRGHLSSRLSWVRPDERLAAVAGMLEYSECQFFPLQEYITSGLLPSESAVKLFDLKMGCSDSLVRAQAIFSLDGLSDVDAEYLRAQWRQRPEFESFRRYFSF